MNIDINEHVRSALPAAPSEAAPLVERLRTRPTGDPYLHMMVHEAADEIERLSCALDYYRAGLEQRAPKFVPARVRVAGPVRGDYPIGHRTLAEAGDHDCESNRWGAISVRATNGQMLGVKPAEFDVLTWRANETA